MLERRTYADGTIRLILTRCPACGEPVDEQADRAGHIGSHNPVDFGLSPIEERPSQRKQPYSD
jgi:hypothetical protein